jgi:type I restriction enzyme, S subunit
MLQSQQTIPLAEVAEVKLGKMLDKSKHTTGKKFRYLRNVNVQWGSIQIDDLKEMFFDSDQVDRFGLKPGDVLVCEGGEPGRAAVWTEPEVDVKFQKALHRVRFQKPFEPKILVYYLEHLAKAGALERRFTGSTIKHFTREAFIQLPVPNFNVRVQCRIVAEIEKQFTRLDAGIAALRNVQAKLKRYRAAVLKAACEGRLVPTEAEVTKSRNSKYETGAELLFRILKSRRESSSGRGRFKKPVPPDISRRPALPEGWTWASVDQLGDVQLGRQRSPKNVSKNYPTKYIRAANITEQGIDVSDVLEMEFLPAERERFTLKNGDLVLSEASGSASQVGKPAIWRDELSNCCFQNTVLRFRPTLLDEKYALTAFKHFYLNSIFAKVAGGVGINHLGAEKFSAIPFALPPLAEQKRIVAEVERRLSVMEELEAVISANLQRASRLRQSILQKAFSGEL